MISFKNVSEKNFFSMCDKKTCLNSLRNKTKDESKNSVYHNFDLLSIYIKKKVCLFVRYAFSPCNSYDHQTIHDATLSPMEGRRGLGMVIGECRWGRR